MGCSICSVQGWVAEQRTIVAPQISDKKLTAKQFCRIHRSYLVNCRFVLQVERYAVTLINGTVLPIPAKRYMEVREEITALIK